MSFVFADGPAPRAPRQGERDWFVLKVIRLERAPRGRSLGGEAHALPQAPNRL